MPTRTELAITLFICFAVAVCCYAIYRIDNQPRIFDDCKESSYDQGMLICTYMGDRWFVKRATPRFPDQQLSTSTALEGPVQVQPLGAIK